MSILSFDFRGNLKPYKKHQLTVEEIEFNFVVNFEKSKTRKKKFQELLRYNDELKELLQCPFYQWINGSFIGEKTNPRDIDLVTFINYDVYQKLQNEIDYKFSKMNVGNFFDGIDAFIVATYPENHQFYDIFKGDAIYWENMFGKTRFNRAKKRLPKGFVELKTF